MKDIHFFNLSCSVEKYFDVSNVRLNMYVRVCVCFSLDKKVFE